MSARSFLAVSAVIAAIPVISGCGSDDVLSPEAVAKAADKTASKGGTRVVIDQTVTVPGQTPISMRGSGVIDPKQRRGRLEFDLSKVPGLPNAIRSEKTQEVRFEGLKMYLRSPFFSATLPAGKRWLLIDFKQAGKAAGIDVESLAQGQDPTKSLDYLKAASGDVKRVGEEDVRGVQTTHYKATIDFNRYPDVVPARNRAAVRRSIAQVVKLAGTSTLPMEVWIGKDGVVRRMKQSVRTLIAPGMRATIDQRIDLFDFGTPVDVQLPPAGEVQDATDLAAAGVRKLTR